MRAGKGEKGERDADAEKRERSRMEKKDEEEDRSEEEGESHEAEEGDGTKEKPEKEDAKQEHVTEPTPSSAFASSASASSVGEDGGPLRFRARFQLHPKCVVSSATIKTFHIDFKRYFHEQEEERRLKAQAGNAARGGSQRRLSAQGRVASSASEEITEDDNNAKFSLKPILEDFPEHLLGQIIQFDIMHNETTVSVATGDCLVMRIPHADLQAEADSFWADEDRFYSLISKSIPRFTARGMAQQHRLLNLMKEVRFSPGAAILKEGVSQPGFYIIASGSVRLECMDNPFRVRDNRKESILSNIKGHRLYDKGAGTGHLSHTFNKSTLGIVTAGTLIGEENCVLEGELPQFYSAICETEVRVFYLAAADYNRRFA